MSSGPPQLRLDPRLERRLREKRTRLDTYRPLPPATLERLQGDLRITLTYHSNAIEGNTLSLWETQLVVEYGLTVGGHPLREILEARNHAEALSTVMDLAAGREALDIDAIRMLHHLVMQGISPEAGQFRTVPVYIRGARLTPPAAREVPSLMQQWVTWLEEEGRAYDPLVAATIAHHGFEAVHPFTDGNGRVGRLLLNLLLMHAGYPPAVLRRDWRIAYLNALSEADTGRYRPLLNLIGRSVEDGLDLYLEACAAPPVDDAYQPLSRLAQGTGYSAAHLGWLARKGRLAATKRGGRWYSTPAAVARYHDESAEGLVRRGRPPSSDKGVQ
jgi:Fic family protein